MTISAFLVSRDHEASIADAVRAAATAADEVLVIDTGSSDRTVELARSAGARVEAIDWADDFSAACNTGLDRLSGDWVLSINPDETLSDGAGELLRQAAAEPRLMACRLPVREMLNPAGRNPGTTAFQTRFFRRDPEIRYVGRLYPNFDRSLGQLAADRGLTVGLLRAEIRHHRYLSQPTPDKLRWAVRLLEAELRDRPGQLRYAIELGRHLLWLNDPRGHEVLGEAATNLAGHQGDPAPPAINVAGLLEYLLSVSPEQSRSPISPDAARGLVVKWFAHTPPAIWAAAGERITAGDYRTAADLLARLVAIGRTGAYDGTLPFDPDVIGPAAVMNLGLCHMRLGEWNPARGWFGQLLADRRFRERAIRLIEACRREHLPTETDEDSPVRLDGQ